MGKLGLSTDACDYNGCDMEPVITDTEWVMCRGHESAAYAGHGRGWRPISRLESLPGSSWPYWFAYY